MSLLPSNMNIYFPAAEPGLEISHFAMRTKWFIFVMAWDLVTYIQLSAFGIPS
jgi:hypothetical protein